MILHNECPGQCWHGSGQWLGINSNLHEIKMTKNHGFLSYTQNIANFEDYFAVTFRWAQTSYFWTNSDILLGVLRL